MSKTPKRWSQHQLTKVFISAAGMSPGQTSDLKYRIWMNPTDDNILRLNLEGYHFVMRTLKLKAYEYELTKPMTNKNLLQLERYFQGMYYMLHGKKIVFFDEAEATMMALYSDDIFRYLETLEESST
jgi:hypothetical protein